MHRDTLEILDPRDLGVRGLIQESHGSDEESRRILSPFGVCEQPGAGRLLETGGLDAGVELHISLEVELVREELAVFQRL